MLNGTYPVIIFYLDKKIGSIMKGKIGDTAAGIAKDGIFGEKVNNMGIAIPLYISESLTGILHLSQSYKTTFSNDSEADTGAADISGDISVNASTAIQSTTIKQRPRSNGVDIAFQANRNSIGINILLPTLDLLFQRAIAGDYYISYFNQNVILFKSKLASFTAEENKENTLVDINISLLKEEGDKSGKNKNVIPAGKGTEAIPAKTGIGGA